MAKRIRKVDVPMVVVAIVAVIILSCLFYCYIYPKWCCTKKLPDDMDDRLYVSHPVDPEFGYIHEAGNLSATNTTTTSNTTAGQSSIMMYHPHRHQPNTDDPLHFTMRQKDVPNVRDGDLYANYIYEIISDDQEAFPNMGSFANPTQDYFALEDSKGQPKAIVLRKVGLKIGWKFEVYLTTPVREGQKPSIKNYKYGKKTNNGLHLYEYCTIKKDILLRRHLVYMNGRSDPDYEVYRAKTYRERRLVNRKNKPVALMEAEKPSWYYNRSFGLTVCPGIDPCLIMILCACVCDYGMDDEKAGNGGSRSGEGYHCDENGDGVYGGDDSG